MPEPGLAHRLVTPPGRMTEDEFVAWCPEDLRAEWVDGEVVILSPSNTRHLLLEDFLHRLLGDFVERRDLGQVLGSTLEIRLERQRRRRLPDISFLLTERLSLIKPTYLDGAPDLIMEIVSPESTDRDWREKHDDYQAAGVREYWVIDPQMEKLQAFTLSSQVAYQPIEENEGRVESAIVAGFYLRPAWLWQKALPKVHQVLGEMGV